MLRAAHEQTPPCASLDGLAHRVYRTLRLAALVLALGGTVTAGRAEVALVGGAVRVLGASVADAFGVIGVTAIPVVIVAAASEQGQKSKSHQDSHEHLSSSRTTRRLLRSCKEDVVVGAAAAILLPGHVHCAEAKPPRQSQMMGGGETVGSTP